MNTKTAAWKLLPVFLLALLLIPYAPAAQAITTVYFNPSADGADNVGDGNGFETNPTFAYADGGTFPTGGVAVNNNGAGDRHRYFNYNISVPDGENISGIEVRVDGRVVDSTFGTSDYDVQLSWDGGTNWTSTRTTGELSQSQQTFLLGGAGDDWGHTWTTTQLNNTNFRVRISSQCTGSGSCGSRDFELDWIAVRVTYNTRPNQPSNTSVTPTTGGFVTSANPTFTWSNFSDPNDGDTQSQFQVQLRQSSGSYAFRDSGAVNSAASSFNSATANWNLPDGNYCWHVRVRDGADFSDYSTETCFTVDSTDAASNAVVPTYANAPFQVTATASDGGSGVANVRLYFRGPTGPWTLVSQINAPGPYQWNFTPSLGNGTYFFQSVACDAANNCETIPSGTGGTGDDNTIYDTVAPASAATPPGGTANTAPIAVPWTASDATSGIAANGVTLYYNHNGGAFNADGTASGTSGTFSFDPVNGDGTYCFYTRAADNAGNVEAAPGTNDGCTTFKTRGSIGDLVWLDADGDGVRDAGESGINGVTLTLSNGTTTTPTTTAGGGAYLFTGLPGAQQVNVLDSFNTAAYSNNNGTRNWTGNWIEVDNNGSGATSGSVFITSGQLRLADAPDTGTQPSLAREVNLSGSSSATFSFDYNTSGNLESDDQLVVEVSSNGGGSYSPLETFSNDSSGSRSYNISPYISANTRIRFRVSSNVGAGDEYFAVDNVEIQYQDTSQSTYTVTVDASNFNPGGALNGLAATSSPPSPLVIHLDAGADNTSADFGFGAFAAIGDLVYQDNNRNGAFDSGEPGLPNITVQLYTDANGNGRIDGADSAVSGKSASTDSSGLYVIRGVAPGSYTVLADVNDPDLPGGFRPFGPNPVAVANVTAPNTYNNADIGFNTPPPVTKPLYLRVPTNLTRNQPTGLTPSTVQILSSEQYHDHSITWQMPTSQALAGPLTFVTGQPVQAVLRIQSNPSTSALACGGQLPDVTVSLSVVGAATPLDTTTVNDMPAGLNTRFINLDIPAGTTIPAGGRLQLKIDTSGADCSLGYPNGNWQQQEDADGYIIVYFDSLTDLSRLELPVVSYIKIDQDGTFDAAYPGGAATPIFIQGDTAYVRATASDPFGSFDISGMTLSVPGVVTNATMTRVATTSLTSTYERALPSLAGGSYSYVITATEGLEGQITAVATGTFQAIFSNLGNSSKTVNRATAAPGDVLTYTIVLSNTGGLPATVSMTDTLPANVTHLNGPTTPPGAGYNAGLNAVTFNGSVPANNQVTITYSVRINTVLDNGTIIANSATISDTFGRFDTSPPATTVIQSAPNLSQSTKTVNLTTATPGDSLEYTIVLSNTGNMNAVISQGNPVIDDIPVNTGFNGGLFASAGQISYNPGFNRVEWYGTVPAGNSVTLRFRARVNTPLDNSTVITNTATINEGTGFPTPQTYQRTASTTITSAPNLASQSAKLVDKALAVPGDGLAYTIILRNSGNMNAPGVVLTDTLPAQVTWGGDAFLSATSGTATFITATRTISWTGDLSAGATVQILFRATANTPLANNTQIVNVARVSDGAGNFTPFNLQAITTIQSTPNLNTSTKTVNTATAVPGDVLTYTIRLVNSGNAVANTTVLDTLPAQLQNPVIISVSGGQAQVTGGNAISWTGQVTPTQPVTLTFRATLLSVLNNGTQVSNTAQVNDGVNPAFFINPPAVTSITSSPNLGTSLKTVNLATASPSDLLIYTITLTNTGNMVASAQVLDPLPPNVTFNGGLSASPGAPLPTYSTINNRISWQGNVAPGAPVSISYQVRINTPLDNGTVILNDAQISDGVNPFFDTTPPAQTTITSAPDLTTSSKAVDLATASPGDLLHYTIRLVNSGSMIATSVSISDTLPTQVTISSGPFVTGGGSGGFNPGQRRIFWSGSVTPGSDVIVDYYVTVNSPLANGTPIVNDATIQGSFGTITTNAVTTTVQSDHQLTLTKNAPTIVGAGQAMTYTLQYNVTGNEPAPGVVITDVVPANTAFVSCTPAPCSLGAGNIVTWTLGTINPGNAGVATLRVNVTSPLPNGTVINNTARIFDTDNGAAQSSASTTVTSGHGFSLTKRDTGFDPVQAGGQIIYNLDWAVSGAETPIGVVITDAVPISTTYVSCSGGVTCSLGAGNIVTWTLGNPATGSSGTVTMTVTTANPLPNGTILTNQARISDSNGGVATTDTEQTTVNSSHTLDVEKTAPVSAPAGGQITYSITYAVTGNEAAQNLVIEDVTPPNTTFASAGGVGATIENPGAGNTGTVRWRLGTRNPGATGVVTMTVNVASPLPRGTLINNTATIQDSNGGATDVDSASTSVTSGHAFTLTKSDTPDPSLPNGIINYTLHWVVTGNEPAQNVTITDTIPANTTFFGCSGCSQQGGVVQWNLGNRIPGENGDVTLQVQVNSPLPNGTVISNQAHIFDGNSGTPAAASTTTTVQSGHNLTLSKSAPSIVQAGQVINYTLNWSVTGNEGAPDVVVTDTIPANTTYVAGSCTAGCTVAGGVVTWDLGDLVPGNAGSLNLAVTTSAVLTNGTRITNTARISDTDGGAALASAVTTISSGHGFSLTKRDTGFDPVQAGTQLTYSIDWAVAGTEQAQNVVISDTLPANTTFANCAPAPCSLGAGNVVTWNLGNRNPNAAGTATLTVNVAGALANGTLLTNQARIGDSNGGIAATSNIEQTTVSSSHSLSVNKNAPANAAAGGQIVYTIVYTVSGNEPAQNVVIEDNTPVNTTFASAAGATTINNPGVGNSGLVRWNLPSPLNPGATGVVTLTVNVLSPLPNGTSINNTASIRDSNNGSTGQDTTTTTVGSGHGFTLTKIDTPDPVSPNNLINYTIHWEVTGNETAQNVVITDTIPANTTFFSCGGCSQQGGGTFVQWNLGNRGPGESGDVTLQVRVNPLTPNGTVIPNTARIFDNNNGTRATASTTTTVQSSHTLTIDKRAPVAVAAGQQIVYTIDYNVVGDELAPTVVITDPIPAGTTYVANSCTGGCVVAGGIVTWNLGNLLPGIPGQVQFAVRVDNNVPNGTEITNIAYIRDNSGASATDSTITRIGTDLLIDLADNRETVQPGERITYTASFSGTEPLNFGSVEIDLPANTTFISASGGFLQSGNTIFWLVTSQPAGFFGQRYIVVQLPPVMDNGTVVSTTARIAGDGKSNREDESAVVVSRPDLSTSVKTVSNPGAAPGELVTYQIVLSNTGNMHAYNSTITDVIPAGLTYTGTVTASSGTLTSVGGPIGWQGEVRVGTPVTISFKAQVGSAVAAGTIIQNVVDINDGFNPGLIQKVATIAVGSQAPAVQAIYLPFITRGSGGGSTPPTGPDVELTIRNCGDVNAVGAFWVDLYFNPNEQSVFWPIGHGEGYDWFGQGAGFVVSTLGPGQSVSLHLADAVVKNIPNPLPSSARLYAQVDLFDNATPGIGVVDEGPNGEANNVAGSNGRTCSATAGKPDLIVESIKLVGTSSAAAASTAEAAQVEGVAVAPARIQPPQH